MHSRRGPPRFSPTCHSTLHCPSYARGHPSLRVPRVPQARPSPVPDPKAELSLGTLLTLGALSFPAMGWGAPCTPSPPTRCHGFLPQL